MSTPRLLSNRYELGETLGYGGMSEVHKGKDVRLSRDVAIKVLRADLARDAQFQERFRREAQNSAALNHPAIVAVYDTGETETQYGPLPYIVMEYVDGRTLRDIVKTQGPLSNKRAMEVMADVSAALDFSHRHGIVHRDVKPANVMITRSGAVKVMDFGIARAVHDGQAAVTQTAAVIGTAQYLSPEQAKGEAVDGRSDVYASGCVLFELLTGEPPFTGDSPVAVAYQHVREEPKSPSSLNPKVSPALDSIVLKAMAKGPANRYQSAAELRADLVRVLSGQRPSAPVVMTSEERTALLDQQSASAPTRSEAVQTTSGGGRHRQSVVRERERERDREDTGNYSAALEEERERLAARRRMWMITIVVLLCAGVLALAIWITTSLLGDNESSGGDPKQVTVPTLIGKSTSEARGALSDAGLEINLQLVPCQPGSQPKCDPAKDVDRVLETSPTSGKSVDRNSKITVMVGTNPDDVEVPDLTGLSVADAQAKLGEDWKLDTNQERVETSDPAKVDKVVEQNPMHGTKAPKGTTITIKIGKEPEAVTLPNVIGVQEDDARSSLEQSGFKVQVKQVDSATDAGQVIAQDPGAGRVEKGSTVTLSVSKGNMVSMPDLRGMTENEAKAALRQFQWNGDLQTTKTPVSDLSQDRKVQSQQTSPGSAITKAQRITVVIGEFRPGASSTPPSN
ncbi:Stk1 family PASTA domain-containing Ser/Thr kinase [Actinosynnema mirum]|uniref:non-specific serine/threonine protein kinase n=1 Tax=Actinosynnema mirum (strain ATCC 29888 / DSM 43827 / JCM 3225 / NBRC 14064 / NCIMB 13271 / NRRL B-12336 / IMRU 3971 / 101) TaxID=446462 RepID=C6WCH4_ACTMD|nr:Stk1 family PASTA domain-containing Ser/Thr kinase [Actinosynnema mirum]ACU33995.1 serine/threonine protein kinase with PASTA sensor(s) [Actinosynnema mirum DSM 43827]